MKKSNPKKFQRISVEAAVALATAMRGRPRIGVERHTVTLLNEHADNLRAINPNLSHAIRKIAETALPRFCDQCGKPMTASAASFGVISSCGSLHIIDHSKPTPFCSRCGKPLKIVSIGGLGVSGCDCK